MVTFNRSTEETITSELRKLGLSTYAARTYVALLSHPFTSASFLCKETGIPDSKIYYALDELSKKGMIAVQKGTPSIYKPLPPEEAMNNLKQQLTEDFDQKVAQADRLSALLTPVFESVEGGDEMELAYVIRGRRNIIRKMKDLISSARKEVVVFISEKDVLDELKPLMMKKANHGKAKFAVTKELSEAMNTEESSQARILSCPVNLAIADMKTLITVSSWKNEVAIMTNDKALITMSLEYYANPSCCQEPRQECS